MSAEAVVAVRRGFRTALAMARVPVRLSTLGSGQPMNRLIQGDVGSGKTVVAAYGLAVVLMAGAQAAVMAPTSILAEQHYTSFSSLLSGEDGLLQEVGLQRMELGEPDESGRRRPEPIEGATTTVDADLAVVAIGNGANPLLLATVPELEKTRWGTIAVDEATGRTSMPGVFAGGDIVTGGATVTS